MNESILTGLTAWKGKSAAEIHGDSSLFSSIFQGNDMLKMNDIAFFVPHLLSLVALFDSDQAEKSLQIVLVRDVDGKTFWDALDEAISPRIKSPSPVDKTALSTFQGIFQNRPLNKGSVILLTWTSPSKMLVSTIFSHAN